MKSIVAILMLLVVTRGAAGAPADCMDVVGLKRFAGSSIVLCDRRAFTEYTLPTGKSVGYDFNTKTGTFEASVDLDGSLAQNVYAVPMGASAAEVFRNYQANLAEQGYTTLFSAKKSDTGPSLGSFFENMGPGTQIWGYSPDEARYLAAVRDDAGGTKTYIALYVVEYQDGYEPKFSPQKGQVMVRLDAVQTGHLADRMVVVSAAKIGSDLASDGKIALYGILFDFNKATVRPESRPAFDEIGKFLRQNPTQAIYVIGHTDNVGGFDFNMQLSTARARAVVEELSKTYGIASGRMTASGVGLQAPVASNASEEGRAKNRRVELLPR